jgi:hypothetical protein
MAVSKVDAANQIENKLPTTNLGTGAVLQLKSTNWGNKTASSSSTYADISNANLSITPSSTSSKIYFQFSLVGCRKQTGDTYMGVKLFRQINGGGYSEVERFEAGFLYSGTTAIVSATVTGAILDSPATTDQVDYKLQFNSGANVASVAVNHDAQESSNITLMEIAG